MGEIILKIMLLITSTFLFVYSIRDLRYDRHKRKELKLLKEQNRLNKIKSEFEIVFERKRLEKEQPWIDKVKRLELVLKVKEIDLDKLKNEKIKNKFLTNIQFINIETGERGSLVEEVINNPSKAEITNLEKVLELYDEYLKEQETLNKYAPTKKPVGRPRKEKTNE